MQKIKMDAHHYIILLMAVIANVDIYFKFLNSTDKNEFNLNQGRADVVKYLIENGADKNAKDNIVGATALHYSSTNGN